MPVHLALLGRLHLLVGLFALLCGASLLILSVGTRAAIVDLTVDGPEERAGVGILAVCGSALILGGVALVAAGRALDRRSRLGRVAALVLAVFNLPVVPFGTALSVYSFWVLLNDEARREFGRPLRGAVLRH
jgi:hypothetical protein